MYEVIVRIFYEREIINGKVMFLVVLFGFFINFIMVIWFYNDYYYYSSKDYDYKKVVFEEECVKLVFDFYVKINKMMNINF